MMIVGRPPCYAAEYELRKLPWRGSSAPTCCTCPGTTVKAGGLPLAIALHGAGGSAADFAQETGFAAAGDAIGIMVAFPDGTVSANGRATFNAQICCGDAIARQIDDIGFVGAVIDDIARTHALDRGRVFATGMSNGGMLAHQLAALHPEWFAAIAPVSAAIGGMTRSGQTYLFPMPALPVPVLIIHGLKDRLVLMTVAPRRI